MKKDSAAVTLGRRGGLKGGVARAASLTSAQRSASAGMAVRARWAKAGKVVSPTAPDPLPDTSDHALAALLKRLRTTADIAEIRLSSEEIEKVVFHKQFANA